MIQNLLIKNYALIRSLQMEPSPNFNTITGETGAGKSIMLGALGLLLGNRADTKVLFEEGQKCVIEGTFNIQGLELEEQFDSFELDYQDETIIRREISPAGKSRAFINDTPVTLEAMKSIGNYLVDVHSQRDTYLLGTAGHQLRIVDGYAQNKNLIVAYREVYREFKKQESAYRSLLQHAEDLSKESDYNHFLFEELEKTGISDGELSTLEEEQQLIENAEEIKTKLFESQELLENSEFSVNSGLQLIAKNIAQLSKIADHFEPLRERIESCVHELQDISKELDAESHKVEFDKARQEAVQSRLAALYQLFQKHHVSTENELLAIQAELQTKVDKVLNIDEELAESKHLLDELEQKLKTAGEALSQSRIAVLNSFKIELEQLLKELAMPFATIEVSHQLVAPTETGMDKIVILFSANAGVAPDELKNVASGGEFSRLMFCIKYILAGKTSLPTIIFDEIDTGISGEIALKLVKMMKEMASRHQVVAITHLPQIAASGDEHYFVYKEEIQGKSVSSIRRLQSEEREKEIAKMIGGDHPTEAALESAKELLNR